MAIKKGKSMCIFSAKGGVGKTLTTLNLAGIYESIGKKVLIIDLDLAGGGIGVALNVLSERNIFNLAEDINNNRYSNFNDYVTKYDKFIDFIASPKDPRLATKLDASCIELILDRASYIYDIILIDANHFLNDVNLVTLDCVDKILFIMTNDPLDLKNMKSLLAIFRDLGIEKYKILLNGSVNPYKDYFSEADIKNILKNDINYKLSPRMFVKDIDTFIMNGKVLTLEPKMPNTFPKDYTTLMSVALDAIDEEGARNE